MLKDNLILGLAAFTVLGLTTGLASAQEPAAAQSPEQIASSLCATCHGENGAHPVQPDYAILAGQHAGYIYSQLKDYKSGARANPIMAGIASGLEREQMVALAKYFEKQPWPDNDRDAEPANIARGKQVATSGQCSQCHLGGFLGASTVPRLAGQQYEYLRATMLAFKNKERTNSPAKNSLFAEYTVEDIEAMADYLAGMDSGQIKR